MDVNIFNILLLSLVFLFVLFISLCATLIITAVPYANISRSEDEKYFLNKKNGVKKAFPTINDPWSVTLSVIVPAYNEEERLPPMLDECIEFLEERKRTNDHFNYEIIIVSDGSKDRTVDVGVRYSEKYGSDCIRVLSLQPNRGKGGAVQLGVHSCRGAVILFADADGATKFKDLIKVEAALQSLITTDYLKDPESSSCSLAVVCGSRAHLEKEAIASRSIFRTLLMHGFHFLVWSLTVRTVRDTQCGFKLFTRETARKVFSNLHVQRWAFDVELLYIAEALRIPIEEVSVNWTEIEGSKIVPVLSWLQMGKDLLLIWLRYKIGAWKIRSKSS